MKKYLSLMVLACFLGGYTGVSHAFDREIETINEGWKFIRQEAAGAEKSSFDDSGWETVILPHTFNRDDVFKGPEMYRGIAWYRKTVLVENKYSDKKVFVEFEGVALVAEVWFNGVYLGKHAGGYTGFKYDLTGHIVFGKNNVLSVKVDNSNNRDVAPYNYDDFQPFPVSADYAVYGGIYRDVYIVITDKAVIDNTFITTPEVSRESARVQVETEIKNNYTSIKNCELQAEIVDAQGNIIETMKASQAVEPGSSALLSLNSGAISNPNLWSPANPYLYEVRFALMVDGKKVDSIKSNMGIRWLEWQEYDKLKLNGEEIFFRGINRHQDREGYGYAMPDELHVKDMELIKSVGFNLVRLAHYPQDPAVLDACDRLGLMVWEEIPVTNCISSSPAYSENAKQQMREMIRQHRNHPSIVLWSLGNESDQKIDDDSSEKYTNKFFRELNEVAHEEDPTRKTISCNQHLQSNADIPDIYAPQHWYGWYGGFLDEHGINLDERHRRDPFFIIGEYGAASSLDLHEERPAPGDWSQEFQCEVHESYVQQAEKRSDWFMGQCLWVAFDFASPRKDRGTNPVKFMNQKGLWTHDREPKDVYYFYKSHYTEGSRDPMVYIVSHYWLDRWKKPAKKNVWVYSNCEEVELFNGDGTESLGIRTKEKGKTRFAWKRVKVNYNVLYAEGRINGKVVATDRIVLENLPAPGEQIGKACKKNKKKKDMKGIGPVTAIELECNPNSLPADSSSKSVITAKLLNDQGLIVEDADMEVTFTAEPDGKLLGKNPVKPKKGIAKISFRAPSTSMDPELTIKAETKGKLSGSVDISIRHIQ